MNDLVVPKRNKYRSVLFFIGSFVIALGLTWLVKEPTFTDSQVYVFFLLFFSVGLWITEAIPAFAVALFIMAYLVFTLGNPHFNSAPEKIDRYVNTFSSSIIWLLLGGFFLAAAMTKTKLDERLLKLTLRVSGTKPRNIVIAFMCTTMFASMIMSNTATTVMLVAALMPLLTSLGKSGVSKALLLGISISATTGGMATIIGTPPNAIAAGILENEGVNMDFLHWIIYGMPVAIVLTAISCFVLIRRFVKTSTPVSLDFQKDQKSDEKEEPGFQRKLVLVVLVITILFWLTGSLHGISVAAVAAIPIVIFTLTGVINADDIRGLPWDTLFLIAGSMSLGEALESTRILEHYANQMQSIHIHPVAFLIIFAYVTMIFTNIMSNAAASTVLIPLAFALLPDYKVEAAMTIGLSASTALFLPVSTPPNAICFSTGLLRQKDFLLGGILIGIIGPVLSVLWVLLVKG
ncbi:MAG: SLC13 family permease [Bacteroidetes bacterium]|nr:MAG: SLC13 family permease [Bacteroidota bacterium]